MAKKAEFELNLPGLNELMKSGEMRSQIEAAANEVAHHAGDGVTVEVDEIWDGKYVVGARVVAESEEADAANKAKNTLLKAVGSAGLPMVKK